MSYSTLHEAADWLTWRLGGIEVLGSPVTPVQVLRFGVNGHLPICVALDTRCYSPTVKARNEKAARTADPTGWFRDDLSGQKAMEAATVEVFGLYVVPIRTLFGFEVGDTVDLHFVTSLDGANSYRPFEKITRDRLRVLVPHIEAFAAQLCFSTQKPEVAKMWTESRKADLRAALDAGQTQKALAAKHGVSRQRIAELAGRSKTPAPSANNPFLLVKPKRLK